MADLIERQAAIDGLDGHRDERRHLNDWQVGWNEALDWVQDIYLEDLPSTQPEQKVGKWIRHEDEDGEPYGHNCSICGEWYVMPYGKTKFCPNCGAKMEEQDADGA